MNTTDLNNNSIRAFATASLIFGALSMFTFFTGFLPLINGGLGILFATLSRREDRPFPSSSWWGTVLSCLGIFMGVMILSYLMISMVIPMMTDPAFYEEMKQMYQNTYGIDLDQTLHLQ